MKWTAFTIAAVVCAGSTVAAEQDGAAIYQKHCAQCHDGGVARAPQPIAMKMLTPERVMEALTVGKMAEQGKALTLGESRAVATFVTAKPFGSEPNGVQGMCAGPAGSFDKPFVGPHWNGWGVDEANARMQPAAMAGLNADQVSRLKLKWAFGFSGGVRTFGQPTVVGGRIFVGSDAGKVYSLDARSGCIIWTFKPEAPARSAISIGPVGDKWAAYFGDQRANAYAVDAATGTPIWKVKLDDHPAAIVTGSPKLYDGRVYFPDSSYEEVTGASPKYECCKFRGAVTALDAATGKVIWKSYTIPEEPKPTRKTKAGTQLYGPAGAGVWSSPTIDVKRRAIYVTTGDAYSDPPARTSDAFLAFDLDTGKMLWSRQMTEHDAFNLACAFGGENCPEAKGPDFDFGNSPILVDLPNGKRALIAGQKSGMVHAIDPDQQGEVIWQTRAGEGGALGGVQWGSASDGHNVYVAVSDYKGATGGAKTPGAVKTLFGYVVPDSKAGGGLLAFDLATGKRVWYAPPPGCGDKAPCSPAQSAAVTLIPGVVFSGSLDGHMRAYSTANGHIIWDVDTAHEFTTVNGVKGVGGSIDGPGAVVVGGTVYVNSGYGSFGGLPGNVLLAFSVDGK